MKTQDQILEEITAHIKNNKWDDAVQAAIHAPFENMDQRRYAWSKIADYSLGDHVRSTPENPFPRPTPMPESAIRAALSHISTQEPQVRDAFLRTFAVRAGENSPLPRDLLQEMAWKSRHMPHTCDLFRDNPHHGFDTKHEDLRHTGEFWNSYERDVEPRHFAAVQSWLKGWKPVKIKDHRGRIAKFDPEDPSSGASRLSFEQYAKATQSAYLEKGHPSDEEQGGAVKHIDGVPHILCYRGVAGNYGAKIRDAFAPELGPNTAADDWIGANPDHKEAARLLNKARGHTIANKAVTVPCAHLASWTTDPSVARGFAERDIDGQTATGGVIIKQWKPITDLLHSGYHRVLPGQSHVHIDESELIFKHQNGKLRILPEHVHAIQHQDGDWTHAPKVRPKTPKVRTPKAPKPVEATATPAPAPELKKAEPEAQDEILRLLQHPDPVEAKLALKLEGVTPAHLEEALSRGPELRAAAIAHPAMDSATLRLAALASSDPIRDAANRTAIVKHPMYDDKVSETLARRSVTNVPVADMIANPKTSSHAIHQLLNNVDPDGRLAQGLLQHPNTTPDSLAIHFRKHPPLVNTKQMSIFQNADLSPEHLNEIAAQAGYGGYHAFAHPNIDPALLYEATSRAAQKTTPEGRYLGHNPALESKHLHQLLASPDHATVEHAIKHPNIDATHIEAAIARGSDKQSRYAQLLSHPSATEDQVGRAFAQHQGGPNTISETLLEHPKMPRHILMASLSDGRYARSIMANPSIDSDFLMEALKKDHGNSSVSARIIEHKGITQDHLLAAMASPDLNTREMAFGYHKATPETIHKGLLALDPNDLYTGSSHGSVLRNQNAGPETIAHSIDTAPNPDEREARLQEALDNKNTPVKYLDELMVRGGSASALVLKHANHTSAHVGLGLLSDNDTIRGRAVASAKATPDQLRNFAKTLTAVDPEHTLLARHIAANPNAASDTLEHLASLGDTRTDGAIVRHSNVTQDLLKQMGQKYSGHGLAEVIDKKMGRHFPDALGHPQVVARVGKGNTGKLRTIRDLILAKEPQKKEVSPKALPPGDWSMARLPNGNISADKMQAHIDSIPGQRYNIGETDWGVGDRYHQRHSHDKQKVFQLNLTNEHIQKIKDAGLWKDFESIHDSTQNGIHPNGPTTMGWIRWTGGSRTAPLSPLKDPVQWAAWAKEHLNGMMPAIKSKIRDLKATDPAAAEDVHDDLRDFQDGHIEQIASHTNAHYMKEYVLPHTFIKWCKENIDKNAFDSKKHPSARPTGKPGIFVDEVQSDWAVTHVKKTAGQARKEAEKDWSHLPEEERGPQVEADVAKAVEQANERWPESAHKAIAKIAFGDRPPQEVLAEAFMQHLRDKGHHTLAVQWHSSESKHHQLHKLGYLEEGQVPAHMKVGYEETPKKMGMQPSTYGQLATQQRMRHDDDDASVAKLDGQPTYEGTVKKFEESLEGWLAKALHPADFTDIKASSTDTPAVDHTPLMKAHPRSVDPHKRQFQGLVESPKLHIPTMRNNGGVTAKLVYAPKDSETKVMIKPFHELPPKRADLQAHYPHPLAGWAEMTHQALYHAAGIGDMHQKVHIAEHDMGSGTPEPAVVIHLGAGYQPVCKRSRTEWHRQKDVHDSVRKIALMDFLTGNQDRHDENLMFHPDTNKLMAIDHGFAFQYMTPALNGKKYNQEPFDAFSGYIYGKAPDFMVGDSLSGGDSERDAIKGAAAYKPALAWWKDASGSVRAKMEEHLRSITDSRLQSHVRENFLLRADYLDHLAHEGPHPYFASDQVAQEPFPVTHDAPGAGTSIPQPDGFLPVSDFVPRPHTALLSDPESGSIAPETAPAKKQRKK